MAALGLSPWHIMASRWALESNLAPGVFLIAVYLLVCAAEKRSARLYCASAAVFALSMYAYATVCIVMPLFAAAAAVFLLRKRRIGAGQMLLAAAVFLALSVPLLLFYAVNLFGLDSIETPFFSAPRLSAMRGVLAFDSIGKNFMALLRLLVIQNDGLPWNNLPNIGITYIFMTPFALAGIFSAVAERKRAGYKTLMLIWFGCAVVLGCVVEVNTNRINFIFIPLIYLISEGAVFVCARVKAAKYVIGLSALLGFAAFNGAYFGEGYARTIERNFYESFGEAIQYASALDGPVYVTNLNGAYALTLFYTETDPREFLGTVAYTAPDVEFRPVESFGKYRFYMPPQIDPDAAYVVDNADAARFDATAFATERFRYYSALRPLNGKGE
jgi:hypothetical protein